MATKAMNKKDKSLTLREKNILKMKKELNKPDPNAIHPFEKYKVITYVFNIIFPPYALYRIWKKDSPFDVTEKAAQTMMIILYVLILVSQIL